MKLITIFRFEFSYLVQQLSTWLYLAVLLTFTIVMDFLITPGDGVYVNNTFHITAMTVIGGFIWLMMGAAIAGDAAARDIRTRMHPLTYTMPVSKVEYLGGRFLAAFAINALLVLSLPPVIPDTFPICMESIVTVWLLTSVYAAWIVTC